MYEYAVTTKFPRYCNNQGVVLNVVALPSLQLIEQLGILRSFVTVYG